MILAGILAWLAVAAALALLIGGAIAQADELEQPEPKQPELYVPRSWAA
jgi:hypothetical protein